MKKIICLIFIMCFASLIAGPHHGGRGHGGRGCHGGPPPRRGYYHHGFSSGDRGLWRANQIVGIVANGLGIVRNLSYPYGYYYSTPVYSYPSYQYYYPNNTVIYAPQPATQTTIVAPQQQTYPEVVNEPVYQYQIVNGQRVLVRIR